MNIKHLWLLCMYDFMRWQIYLSQKKKKGYVNVNNDDDIRIKLGQ